jgi:hypothetical protein
MGRAVLYMSVSVAGFIADPHSIRHERASRGTSGQSGQVHPNVGGDRVRGGRGGGLRGSP